MVKHLQEVVAEWAACAAEHEKFDGKMEMNQQLLADAQEFDDSVCSHAYKLQSQLLLEEKVKVSVR